MPKKIILTNYRLENNKLYKESNKNNQDLSLIKCCHHNTLKFHQAHYDHTEQFLVDTKFMFTQ